MGDSKGVYNRGRKTAAFILAACLAPAAATRAADEPVRSLSQSEKEGLQPYAELPSTLTLAEAVKLFRERGYSLLIADASVVSARGNLTSAGQFANPSVDLGAGGAVGVSATQGTFISLGVSDGAAIIDELLVGKRRLRADVARAALDSARFGRADTERTMVEMVKQQWVATAAARQQLDNNVTILKSNQDTENLIQVRYHAGSASEVDLSMQKSATFEAAQQVAYAQAAYEQAKVQLAFLLGHRGRPATFDVPTGLFDTEPGDDVLAATPESLRQRAEEHRPDVLAQRAQVIRAEAALRSVHRQVVPDATLGLSFSEQGFGANAVSPATLVGSISVTPPFFYRQEGEITMAEADLRTQQVTLAQSLAQVVSDIDAAYSALKSARDRRERLMHGYLEQSRLQYDLTRIQYEKGAASLVDLLVAQRTYIATVTENVQANSDFWSAIFGLEAAVGTEFKQ